MKELIILKIGGQVVDDPAALDRVLRSMTSLPNPCLLIHGGGKQATRMSERLGLVPKMIDGRRLTDADTLEVVTMVYGGLINKQIVASLQALGRQAIGLTGADGDLIRSKKREHTTIDYGYVGDVTRVNVSGFDAILERGQIPVMAPLTHDGQGQLLNTNADTIARSIAVAMSGTYRTRLVFGFEKAGVLLDLHDEGSVIPHLNQRAYESLKLEGTVQSGMIPKLDNAFSALTAGVAQVIIGKAELLPELLDGKCGTTLTHE